MSLEIEDYAEPVKVNPFTPLVKQLAAAGEGKLGKIRVPKDEKPATARAKFSKAAREEGFTAHLKVEDKDTKTGEVVLGFVLGPIRTRKTKAEAESGKIASEAVETAEKG